MKTPQIGLVTLFLPRMEVDHLEEWLTYHRAIGVTHFYLYDNRHLSYDSVFGQGKSDRVWHKKPEANYHLELEDFEIDQKIQRIIENAGNGIHYIQWPCGSSKCRDFRSAQLLAANTQLKHLQASKDVEWLGHLDIDELLVPDQSGLMHLLSDTAEDISALKISQKLFESRWKEQQSIPYANIAQTFGVLEFNHKIISRVGYVKKWLGPHSVQVESGRIWNVPHDTLRFHHFRGNQHFGQPAPPGWGIHEYNKLKDRQLEYDSSHVLNGSTNSPG